MKFYPLLTIGDYHTNHCEDYFTIVPLGSDRHLCAVMDGCTMGKDSYFASTLVGKLLKKIAKERSYQQFYEKLPKPPIEDELKSILQQLFAEVKTLKNQLFLETNDLLTTLILMILDRETQTGIVFAIGDGVVCINGKLTVFEQDNKPDYLAYHLNESFEEWYNNNQHQKLHIDSIQDISIATDGIETFASVAEALSPEEANPMHWLLIDATHADRMKC